MTPASLVLASINLVHRGMDTCNRGSATHSPHPDRQLLKHSQLVSLSECNITFERY